MKRHIAKEMNMSRRYGRITPLKPNGKIMTDGKAKAAEEAVIKASEISVRLDMIKGKMWLKANAAKNWADVGSLNHVLEMVKEIEQFLK